MTDTIFLLVGRRDITPAPPVNPRQVAGHCQVAAANAPDRDQLMQDVKETVNWLRGESRWIAIGPQSGRVVTTENAFVVPEAIINKYAASPYFYSQGTDLIRNQQIIAAREFARQMNQMGGG